MSERNMKDLEGRLAKRLSGSLKGIQVRDVVLKTSSWREVLMDGDKVVNDKRYPVVRVAVLKLNGGKTLIVSAEGKVMMDGKVRTRLQLDLKEKNQEAMLKYGGYTCAKGCGYCDAPKRVLPLRPKLNVPMLLNRARVRPALRS